jgi:hypothetical protein
VIFVRSDEFFVAFGVICVVECIVIFAKVWADHGVVP